MSVAYLATGLGHQWVIVFFVMSGYLVGGSVLRSVNARRWSWRSYLMARLTRLYIVLLPALMLGGVIDWVGMHIPGAEAIYSGRSGIHAVPMNVYTTLNLPALLGNLLFLQTIVLPGMGGRPVPLFGSNGPLWELEKRVLVLHGISSTGAPPGQEPVLAGARNLRSQPDSLGMVCGREDRLAWHCMVDGRPYYRPPTCTSGTAMDARPGDYFCPCASRWRACPWQGR